MEKNSKINIFIQQYNDLINEIYLLKNKIIDNSRIRFKAISDFLVDLEEKFANEFKEKENELDNYSERENSILSVSIKLLEDFEHSKLKKEETKELLLNSEDEYNNELIKFNNLVNNSVANVSIDEFLKGLELIGNLGYFDESLIEELIDLLKKFNLVILSFNEIEEEIAFTNVDDSVNNKSIHR